MRRNEVVFRLESNVGEGAEDHNMFVGDSTDIGLLLHPGHDHTRQIALGAVEFHRAYPSVRIVGDGYRPLISWDRLNRFEGDGLIAVVNHESELKRLQGSGIPFVLSGARFMHKELHLVVSDNEAIGRLAAEHLISCGIKTFLFAGALKWDDEKLRLKGFRKFLNDQSFDCNTCNVECEFLPATGQPENMDVSSISNLLRKHSNFPLGVFCPSATGARATVFACQQLGLEVPDRVAVVAVNNDQILCETSEPPLTSIVQNSKRIGFSAAQLLVERIAGKPISQTHRFVEPLRVSVRHSSDVIIVGNPLVESALRFMRDNASSQIEIQDIANHIGTSRRTLELRFRETVDSTPRQSLLKMRLEIAKSLLFESEIPITQIALRSGFASSQVFSSVFKKECGITPSQYRRKEKSLIFDN